MSFVVKDDFEPINGYKPTLPSDADIMEQCKAANNARRLANPRDHFRGAPVVGADGQRFWVKYGAIPLAEARTQHYVAQVVSRCGDSAPVRVPAVHRFIQARYKNYIVMDFVDGEHATAADARAVAAAVSFLITIKAPEDQPGPGPIGPVCHDFFIDRVSPIAYPTLELLSSHINGILKHERITNRVDFGPEFDAYGLRLCLSDTNCGNFIIDAKDKKVVAIDFEVSCFLPISFFEMALGHYDPFTWCIRPFVVRPLSTQADLLGLASACLVKYQTSEVGLPLELWSRKRR